LSVNGNANTSFVQVKGVSKWFGSLQVLNPVSLDVPEHNVVCLIGASGSGKSTLLRCLNRLEAVERGEITIDGQNVREVYTTALELRCGSSEMIQWPRPHPTSKIVPAAPICQR